MFKIVLAARGLDDLVDQLCDRAGKPDTLLADAGYAGEDGVNSLEARIIEPLIAVSRQQAPGPCDFSPAKATGQAATRDHRALATGDD